MPHTSRRKSAQGASKRLGRLVAEVALFSILPEEITTDPRHVLALLSSPAGAPDRLRGAQTTGDRAALSAGRNPGFGRDTKRQGSGVLLPAVLRHAGQEGGAVRWRRRRPDGRRPGDGDPGTDRSLEGTDPAGALVGRSRLRPDRSPHGIHPRNTGQSRSLRGGSHARRVSRFWRTPEHAGRRECGFSDRGRRHRAGSATRDRASGRPQLPRHSPRVDSAFEPDSRTRPRRAVDLVQVSRSRSAPGRPPRPRPR